MTETFFLSVAATGFVVAFAHAAIPTHWLPFVLAGRGQRWGKAKTLMVVVLCASGHVLFTTMLGVLVVLLGIETSKWTGNVFPWIAGGALILFGLYYLVRQAREPDQFTASLTFSNADHAHRHEVRFEEHQDGAAAQPAETPEGNRRSTGTVQSDGAVILGLFTLLTFSPCEGFLPVYLSGITYGWIGFVVLSAVLALATIAGMVIFTWLTMSGMERLRLGFLERYESGILGTLIMFLGVGIIFFGF